MAAHESINVMIAGHQLRMTAEPDEKPHVERAAAKVSEAIHKLTEAMGGGATPAKVATMVAFQMAFDLSMADEMLADAERLHEELNREKEAVQRLETLLSRVDSALSY